MVTPLLPVPALPAISLEAGEQLDLPPQPATSEAITAPGACQTPPLQRVKPARKEGESPFSVPPHPRGVCFKTLPEVNYTLEYNTYEYIHL